MGSGSPGPRCRSWSLVRRPPLARSPVFLAFRASFMSQPSWRARDAFWIAADPASWIGGSRPAKSIYQSSILYAEAAQWLAERSGRGEPDNAWVAGLLAPLGWLAACAIDPDAVGRCLDDPKLAAHALTRSQQRFWGLDHPPSPAG